MAVKLTGIPVQIVVADIPRLTNGTTLLLTFIKISSDKSDGGFAQPNEEVIKTETLSPFAKVVL